MQADYLPTELYIHLNETLKKSVNYFLQNSLGPFNCHAVKGLYFSMIAVCVSVCVYEIYTNVYVFMCLYVYTYLHIDM